MGLSLAAAYVGRRTKLGQRARRHYRLAPVVTTQLAQGWAGAGRWRSCSSLASPVTASVRNVGSTAQLVVATGCDAGWGRVGACRARWLKSISSLSAAEFQEIRPAMAPA